VQSCILDPCELSGEMSKVAEGTTEEMHPSERPVSGHVSATSNAKGDCPWQTNQCVHDLSVSRACAESSACDETASHRKFPRSPSQNHDSGKDMSAQKDCTSLTRQIETATRLSVCSEPSKKKGGSQAGLIAKASICTRSEAASGICSICQCAVRGCHT
jgi:hypothetical protein